MRFCSLVSHDELSESFNTRMRRHVLGESQSLPPNLTSTESSKAHASIVKELFAFAAEESIATRVNILLVNVDCVESQDDKVRYLQYTDLWLAGNPAD